MKCPNCGKQNIKKGYIVGTDTDKKEYCDDCVNKREKTK